MFLLLLCLYDCKCIYIYIFFDRQKINTIADFLLRQMLLLLDHEISMKLDLGYMRRCPVFHHALHSQTLGSDRTHICPFPALTKVQPWNTYYTLTLTLILKLYPNCNPKSNPTSKTYIPTAIINLTLHLKPISQLQSST